MPIIWGVIIMQCFTGPNIILFQLSGSCHHCGFDMDHYVTHGLNCHWSEGCHHCHAPFSPGAFWTLSLWPEVPRWHHDGTTEEHKVTGVGCNLSRHLCSLIHHKCHQSGWSSGSPSREEEEIKVLSLRPQSRVCFCGHWNHHAGLFILSQWTSSGMLVTTSGWWERTNASATLCRGYLLLCRGGNATSVMRTIALMYLRLLFLPLLPYFLFFISFDEVLFHCINNVLLIFYYVTIAVFFLCVSCFFLFLVFVYSLMMFYCVVSIHCIITCVLFV